jgi:hypothetical protein
MPKQKHMHHSWVAALCLLVFSSLLAGCAVGGGTATSPTATPASGVPQPDSSPKGSGGVQVTASAVSSCSYSTVAPASSRGWNVYKDGRFSFQFAVPPGWRAGSFTDDSGNDYIVQVFPPGSTTPVGQAGLTDQEHFALTIALVGPTSTYASDTNWSAEVGSIMISGVRTTLYDRAAPDCGEVNRGATADFGHHHFTFFLTSIPEKAKRDIALFEGMLQSFEYTQKGL